MSEEETPPPRPKLIVPEAENKGPKSTLLVPGGDAESAAQLVTPEMETQPAAELVAPAVEETVAPEPVGEAPVEALAEDAFVVINEDPAGPEPGTGPVKIAAMTPPPGAEEEVVAGDAVESAPAVEYAEPAVEYAEPAVEYVEPVAEPAYQPPPPLAEPAYQPPPAYTQPPPAVAPAVAPYHQPYPAAAQPMQGGYLPQGYAPPGQAGMPMGGYGAAAANQPLQIAQPKGVPGWALFLLGLLAGFLITLTLFKFTAFAEGLRPDLIERGRKKAPAPAEEEPAPEPEPEPEPELEPEPEPEPEKEAEPEA